MPATLFLFKHIWDRPKLSGPFVVLYLSHCPSFSHPFSSRNFPFLLFLGSQTFPQALPLTLNTSRAISILIFKIYTSVETLLTAKYNVHHCLLADISTGVPQASISDFKLDSSFLPQPQQTHVFSSFNHTADVCTCRFYKVSGHV